MSLNKETKPIIVQTEEWKWLKLMTDQIYLYDAYILK